MKNEKLDQMIHEEMYLCFGKTEQLLGDLYKMIKSNPENDELKMIFENLLSIAKSQIRVNAAVSDSYFSGEIKKYSLEKARRKEQELFSTKLPEKNKSSK
jgi:hypothetical protein